VKDQNFMPAVAQVMEGVARGFRIYQKVGYQDNQSSSSQSHRNVAKCSFSLGSASSVQRLKFSDQTIQVPQNAARGDMGTNLIVEGQQADCIALPQQKHRQGCSKQARILQLPDISGFVRDPVHGLARVQEKVCPQIRLFFKLLYVVPVGAAEHLPVHEPNIIPGVVRAVLGKLDREAAVRRSMQTNQEPIDDPARHEVKTTE